MLIYTNLYADLFMFDGGAGAAGTAGAGAAGNSSATQASDTDVAGDEVIPWDLVGGKPEGLGDVEGNTEPSQGEVTPTEEDVTDDSQSDIDSYEKAKEMYREQYEQDVKKHIDRRFRKTNQEIKSLNDEIGPLRQLREMVARKYPGVDVNDTQALLNAVQGDDSYLRQRAIDNGTTVEEERAAIERDREINTMRERLAEMEEADKQRETAVEINRQSEELKGVYPDFNLQEALQNETFCECLAFSKSAEGVENVKLAYEVAFRDRILQSAVQQTVDSTKAAVAENLRASQYMPSQAGRSDTARANGTQKYSVEELVQMAEDGVDISKFLD